MNLKKGTPGRGLIFGAVLVVLGALVMLIGFWKTLILAALFAAGYFIGAVDKKKEFLRGTANKLIPEKEIKVIDFKKEVKREQEMNPTAEEVISSMEAKTKE